MNADRSRPDISSLSKMAKTMMIMMMMMMMMMMTVVVVVVMGVIVLNIKINLFKKVDL